MARRAQAGTTVVVTRAGAADVPALALVHLTTALHAYADIFPEDAPKPTQPQLEAQWMGVAQRGALFAARRDDEVIGTAHATVLGGGRAEIGGLYVLPAHWGLGVGRSLMDAALGHVREAGCATSELWVLEANWATRAWYERQGWRLVEGITREVAPGVDDVRYRLEGSPGSRVAPVPPVPAARADRLVRPSTSQP